MSQEMLLQAKIYEEEIRDEIQELQEELDEVLELIAKLSAEAVQNPYWTSEDEFGGRQLIPLMNIRDSLLNGSRAERYFANTYQTFQHKGFIATLSEDVPAEHMRMYVDAQNRHFPQAIIGMSFQLAVPKGPDGEFMQDYRIPWWVNQGPYKSTKRFEDVWADPDKLNKLKVEAEKLMARMDRKFFWAQLQNNEQAFFEQYPHYIPK